MPRLLAKFYASCASVRDARPRCISERACFAPNAFHVLTYPHTEPRRTRSIRWRSPKFSLCPLWLREKMRWFLPLLFDFEKRTVLPPQGLERPRPLGIIGRATHARSSIGRAPVSKTGGWGFESLRACQRRRCPADIAVFSSQSPKTNHDPRACVVKFGKPQEVAHEF